jgi:nicotinamidase-related amidase
MRQEHRTRSRPTRGKRALLLLDLISEFKFEDWRQVRAAAQRIAPRISRLKARAHAAKVPVIYVNDTAGRWESDQTSFIARCLAEKARGREIVRCLEPLPQDYFIFKPKHSGFYATPLAELLETLATKELILTGLTSHQCVLFTAMDAYVRDYKLIVPPDCIGAATSTETRHALFVLKEALRATTPLSRSIKLT